MAAFRPEPQTLLIVLALTVGPVLFKFLLVTALARAFGSGPGTALRTGLYLAQAGEFGFVLLGVAGEHQLLPPDLRGPVLASMVLSMLATPFIFLAANRIVMRLSATDCSSTSIDGRANSTGASVDRASSSRDSTSK